MSTRRFLLAPSLARLVQKERGGERVVEGHFPELAERSSFVRIEGSVGHLVLTTRASDGAVEERAEVPLPHAEALLDVAAGEVEYVRSRLAAGPYRIHVDDFIRPGPLQLISVEDDQQGAARDFRPLPWFGPEVTADPGYGSRRIALSGLPEFFEVPLSDAILNHLLDTLENRPPAEWPQARAQAPQNASQRRPQKFLQAEARTPAEGREEPVDPDEELIRKLARSLSPQWR